MIKRALCVLPTNRFANNSSSFSSFINKSNNRFFSRCLLSRKDDEEDNTKTPNLSYSEQITKHIVERYKNILENQEDKSRFDKIREELESEENQTSIQNIIRNVRLNLVEEPSEEIKKAQEDKMDERRRQQFEERKRAEIERRKNAGKEKKEPINKIEYKVVERG
nr:unnamed protein product [Naegleria fowleri]